ncbi:MAG: phytanoyl-CoA dioxygenase family protein [Hyphomicrobiales bacterium]|nr:phytanoyl-CoA dioxygenase family protein [Hyphomicrobiales bacterium]
MYSKEAIRGLGVTSADLSEGNRQALDRDGFFIVEGVYSPDACAEMADTFDRLCDAEGDKGGHEVHIEPGAPRVSNIFNKTDAYDRCLSCKPLLAASLHLLGEFKLHYSATIWMRIARQSG